jgi:tRNA ligase
MPSFEGKFPPTVPKLLDALRALKEANPKATRSSVHIYPASIYAPGRSISDAPAPDLRITSWKMTEHMYFRKDNGFPTLARGLFTQRVDSPEQVPPAAVANASEEDGKVEERIVARGYDKFFNTDEMAWTSVSGKTRIKLTRSGPRSRRTRRRRTT